MSSPTDRSDGPITTIVADFGGVLSTPLAPAFAHVQQRLGIAPEALGAAMGTVAVARGVPPLHELETGALGEREFFALLEDALDGHAGRRVALGDFAALYWGALAPNTGLVEHLRARRRQGYRMGLLTNNVREWEPYWRAMVPVAELFDDVVDSARVGLRKPDPAIYALATRRLGVPPAETVLIDDFADNCDAARAAGWTAVRFETTAQAIGDLDAVLGARGAPPGVGLTKAG